MLAAGRLISERVSLLQPTAVNSILAEMRALQANGCEVVSLMRGEPDFKTPAHVTEACIKALRDGRTGYPDNRGEIGLRQAIAAKLVRDHGIDYDPRTEILVTDGATLGIHAALTALLDPGDEVLLPDPIYDAYHSVVRLAGGIVRPVSAVIGNGRYSLSVEALEQACTPRTKVLLSNTPWNPVGTVLSAQELAGVADFVEQKNLLLISDEIYEKIIYDGRPHVSPPSLSSEIRKRCVLVNSFSKTYSMAGWRLGYCAAPAALIQSMLLALQQSSRGPATFIQDAGATALSGPQDCVGEMLRQYSERRTAVLKALDGIPKVTVPPPEGGFFAFVDIRATEMSSDVVRRRLLHEHQVCVAHGAAYGSMGEGMLRVSFASGGDNLTRGLERLRKGLASL